MTAVTPAESNALLEATLEDRYELREGRVLLSGIQVLARLPMELHWRDQANGWKTGGFISGYRGSPLGGYDRELWRLSKKLDAMNVHFQPGVNEDLAATAVWGTQYVNLYQGANVEGVFGIWYGKSPGVDRSGDAFQHANTAGTAPRGGVIALVGDDHVAKSSSRAGQSDMQLKACAMPILYPSNTQEILDFGLHGIAMSRYSGCWVAVKLVTDVVETTAMVEVGSARLNITEPPLPAISPRGHHIQVNEPPLLMEESLYRYRIPAALAYARANGLNRIVLDPANPVLGIVSAGKSWSDVRSALLALGLDDDRAAAAGIKLLKLGMSWPVDPEILERFVAGVGQILVVEEKRPFIEEQVKSILQGREGAHHVRVWGKEPAPGTRSDPARKLLPMTGELTPKIIAEVIADLAGLALPALSPDESTDGGPLAVGLVRAPNFCSGCPHNTSTVVPDGSRSMAGIGCHGMATWIRAENTSTVTHMGAEGMFWVGQSHFTDEKHVFINLGDGTFFHSGSLAIRQAVAARMRATYKLLFNGYVAMTGGQKHDGDLTVERAISIVQAEGVQRLVIVADDVTRYDGVSLPAGVTLRPRTQLDAVQRELREYDGVSVLIYDQACATERRRQRKRNPALDVARRTLIHPEVCEGCGDCGVKSNCMSVEPLETELGRKRQINQSTCNKDFSCAEGFCPSFVTVKGGALRRASPASTQASRSWDALPMPALPSTEGGYNILIAGIGGTGIVTIGAVLGMAAHLDGRGTSVLDVTGTAQKYGAVMSHVRIVPAGDSLRSSRLGVGEVDLLVGCDLIVASGDEGLEKLQPGRARVVVNTAINPTADFPKTPDWEVSESALLGRLRKGAGERVHPMPADRIATATMGDAIAINMFMLGYAWQMGYVPISLKAIERAIELNDVAIEFNRQSFEWGRRMAVDPAAVRREAGLEEPAAGSQIIRFTPRRLDSLDDIVADRSRRLVAYQSEAYAARYRASVEQAQRIDQQLGAQGRFAKAVARYHYKLMAYKDEFEVARLFSDPAFQQGIRDRFEGSYSVHLNLGAWPFAHRDPDGVLRKKEVGRWIFPAMKVLAALKTLRGSWLDPFRNNVERKLALRLLADYESDLQLIAQQAEGADPAAATELAALPEHIRGYGHVREAHASKLAEQRSELRQKLSTPSRQRRKAA